jgi:hypothetical protein
MVLTLINEHQSSGYSVDPYNIAASSRWFLARGLFYPEDGDDVTSKRQFTQDLHGDTSQKTAFFIVTAVKTSNLPKCSYHLI